MSGNSRFVLDTNAVVSLLAGNRKLGEQLDSASYKSEEAMERLRNIHPGDVLLEEFMKPMGLSRYALAKAIGVPAMRIGQICAGKRSVSADTALRLARFFGTSDTFWMGLQVDYDLEETRLRLHERIQAIEPMRMAA